MLCWTSRGWWVWAFWSGINRRWITYCESVGDVGPFKSVLSLSTSILGSLSNISGPFMSISGPSMSLDDIGPPHTYIDIVDLSSSWGDAPDSSTSVSGLSTSWDDY